MCFINELEGRERERKTSVCVDRKIINLKSRRQWRSWIHICISFSLYIYMMNVSSPSPSSSSLWTYSLFLCVFFILFEILIFYFRKKRETRKDIFIIRWWNIIIIKCKLNQAKSKKTYGTNRRELDLSLSFFFTRFSLKICMQSIRYI